MRENADKFDNPFKHFYRGIKVVLAYGPIQNDCEWKCPLEVKTWRYLDRNFKFADAGQNLRLTCADTGMYFIQGSAKVLISDPSINLRSSLRGEIMNMI